MIDQETQDYLDLRDYCDRSLVLIHKNERAFSSIEKLCLCRRGETIGFDTDEIHPQEGIADNWRRRWITPQDIARIARNEIEKVIPYKRMAKV